MKFFQTLSVKSKLMLMLMPPVVGVVFLSLGATVERIVQYRQMAQVERLAALAAAVNDTIYATQTERVLSVRAVTGRDSGVHEALRTQRAATDGEIARLRERAGMADVAAIATDLAALRDAAFVALEQLDGLRAAVDGGGLGAAPVLEAYSELNQSLLAMITRTPRFSDDAAVASLLTAYGEVMHALEDSGMEAALVPTLLDGSPIRREHQLRLHELAVRQQQWLSEFHDHLPPALRERFSQRLAGDYRDVIEQARETLQFTPIGSGVELRADAWNAAAQARTERLIEVADATEERLERAVGELKVAASLELGAVMLMAVVGLILTFWLAVQVIRRVSRHVKRLLGALEEFANGNMGRRIGVIEGDELGRIARAFNHMADQLQRSAEQQETQREQERAEAEVFHHKVELLGEVLRAIAFGDLTQRIELEQDTELGQLAYHINMMSSGLRELTRGMVGATEELATAVDELQGSARSQSAAAAEQAAATNQTVTTLQEIRTISAQSREKAQGLGRTADRALKEGEEGAARVENSLQAMDTIREKVEAIGRNVQSLRDHTRQVATVNGAVAAVAQQSKMLALNAAIEAAKAGKAGKGFGVVAMEVGTLADQSAQATVQVGRIVKAISQAIDDVVEVVEEGTWEIVQALQYAEDTGHAVQRLSDVVRETATASKQIVAAVSQESIGIEQLAAAVDEINRATRQFAETSRRLEGTSSGIGRISKRLEEQAGVYEI